jgi:putative Mg2+ transporter-C (MgtC) family protein
MELLWEELTRGLGSGRQLSQLVIQLIAAAVLGGVVGTQRHHAGKPAGVRTHMLVCLGTAVVVVTCARMGISLDGQSRVIQGIVTGIGFVGAGSILKLSQEHEIRGLTSAAALWMTAGIGVACGGDQIGIALIGAVLTVIVLAYAGVLERRAQKKD